jgi:2-polyprenyl-3-methyl-5-hydroxy-6-metoxy-1,4-benzoquinol methylase
MARKIIVKGLSSRELKNWKKEKEKEWQKNAGFWIKIIREKLDPYRLEITNKAVLELLKSKKALKILDAGCGDGYLSRILAKSGHQVFGVDFSPILIKAAKTLERKNPLKIRYFTRDIRKTGLTSSYFDAVLSHQTINEISDPGKAFDEFFRILKKKGRLICLFLHPCFQINPKEYFQKAKIKKSHYLVSGIKSPSPYFYLHLPLSEWIRLLAKSGFFIKNIKEPCPRPKLLKKKWWKDNFKKPFFILIETVKK